MACCPKMQILSTIFLVASVCSPPLRCVELLLPVYKKWLSTGLNCLKENHKVKMYKRGCDGNRILQMHPPTKKQMQQYFWIHVYARLLK